MDLNVYEHVRNREGDEQFAFMRRIDEGLTAFPEWQNMSYHMELHEDLKKALDNAKNINRAEEAN